METSIVSAVGIGRNCMLGNGKKIAKFLMRTFTCRSTFLYDADCQDWVEHNGISRPPEQNQFKYREHETGGTPSLFLAVMYECRNMYKTTSYTYFSDFFVFRVRRFSRYACRFHDVFDGAHRSKN